MRFGSPGTTVNDLMKWLNSLLGLRLPLLPLKGWPGYLKALWKRMIFGPLPDPNDPLPWVIPVEGNFDGLFPEGATLEVQTYILVGNVKFGSPDVPVVSGPNQ